MSPLTLRAHEWLLAQAIETGSFLTFDSEQGEPPTIRAQALIDIVLGKHVLPPGESSKADETAATENGITPEADASFPRPIAIRSAGIRFSNAKIIGEFDLQDASGFEGSMLPRLKIVNCYFEKPVRLQRARLRSLSLKGSRFTMLDLSNAHIAGRVDLSGVRGLCEEPDSTGYYGQCWVVMVSTRVEGLVTARYARFVAPPERSGFVPMSWFANYALDMRSANIRGSVILRPQCRALGGISLTLAEIQGSVWASGAEVHAVEESAFSADYAIIRGSIYLRPYDPSRNNIGNENTQTPLDIDRNLETDMRLSALTESERFRATGDVSLFACKLGGSLYMDGAQVRKRPASKHLSPNQKGMVDVRNAEIGGDGNFSAWQCETNLADVYRFESEIKVSLDAARIRNGLTFRGAKVPEVSARNIEIGGRCDFCAFYEKECGPIGFESNGGIEITSAKIGGDLLFCGAKIGVERRNMSSVASDQNKQLENIGLWLAGSTIGGSCFIETFSYRDHATGEQRGLRFECYGVIRFSKAKITRSLRMDGARIEARAESDRATLDLAGSFIGGDAYLRTWHESGAAESYRFEVIGRRTAVRMSGARIGQNLIMNGAKLEAKLDSAPLDQELTRSIYALKAVNADIGGKAELSTFPGKRGGKDENLRFESTGLVSFAMATVSLGLNMEGSQLMESIVPLAEVAVESPRLVNPVKIIGQNQGSQSLTLDLSDARLKFVRLGRDGWMNSVNVAGNLNLDRTKTDAELNLSHVVVTGTLSASTMKVGARLDLSNGDFSGTIKLGGAEIDADLILYATTIRDRLRADGIRVGKSILLEKTILPMHGIARVMAQAIADDRTLVNEITKKNLTILERIRLERRLHRIARLAHLTRKLDADVSFQNGHVTHALKVETLNVKQSTNAVATVKSDANLRFCTIDLRGLHIGELGDSGGEGWTENVRLWLDGFRYDRLPEVSGSATRQARARKNWLDLQYFNPKHRTKREYSPDAYEHLSKALKAIGAYGVAQKIVRERLRLEYRGNLLWAMFGLLFGYGYSIRRASLVFITCILIGWGAVYELDTLPYYPNSMQLSSAAKTNEAAHSDAATIPAVSKANLPAMNNPTQTLHTIKGVETAPPKQTILVLKMSTPEARYSYEKGQSFLVEPDENAHNHADLVQCGNRVDPLLYAIDVFLPVLNLHQEENCSIRPEASSWRRAMAFYAVLGWIITPLSILTFSGILRRHLEK